MKWTVRVLAVAVAILSVAMPARAQDKKVEGILGGGYSAVTGEARDHTGDAGVFEAGVRFNFTPMFSFETKYNYTGLGKEKTVTVPVSSLPGGGGTIRNEQFSADGHMNDVTFNVVLKPAVSGRAAPYVTVGPGVYHRTVNITTPAIGYTTVCNPWWYVCYPVAVPVDQVLGTRSSTDFGMNFGGGVSFEINESASFYVEVRYVYVWGPTFNTPAVGTTPAKSVNANGQAVPITFGFRF